MKEIENSYNESSFRDFLKNKGFEVNYNKSENENGIDIVALKNGYSFLIEFKKLEKRESGSFRYSGDVVGDILVIAMPESGWIVWNDGNQSLTKTARFIEFINHFDLEC